MIVVPFYEGDSTSASINYVTVKFEDKEYTRKLTHVLKNVYKFRFKNKIYHLVFYFDGYDFSVKHFSYLCDKCNYYLTHEMFEDKLNKLVDKYVHLNTEEEHIPAGPDSSKFVAVKAGDIDFRKNYYLYRKYSKVWYPCVVTVGSAVKPSQEFYDELFTILFNMMRSDEDVKISIFNGTARSGYGITLI